MSPPDPPTLPQPDPRFDVVYPLITRPEGVEPFPTLYYLRDPGLVHAMSELERLQWTHRFQERVLADPQLLAGLHADHAAYRDARWTLMTPADRKTVRDSPSLSRAFRSGIAGIANFDRIKCLHAHYAHHLATQAAGGTTVGRLIETVYAAIP